MVRKYNIKILEDSGLCQWPLSGLCMAVSRDSYSNRSKGRNRVMEEGSSLALLFKGTNIMYESSLLVI